MSVVGTLPSNSQMLKINCIKSKKIRKVIKQAKMTELELQNERPKPKRRLQAEGLSPCVCNFWDQKKWQIQIQKQRSIAPNMSELEGWAVSS